jgi:hypothetical protein
MIYQFQKIAGNVLTKSASNTLSSNMAKHQEIENSHNNLTLTTATATAQ